MSFQKKRGINQKLIKPHQYNPRREEQRKQKNVIVRLKLGAGGFKVIPLEYVSGNKIEEVTYYEIREKSDNWNQVEEDLKKKPEENQKRGFWWKDNNW